MRGSFPLMRKRVVRLPFLLSAVWVVVVSPGWILLLAPLSRSLLVVAPPRATLLPLPPGNQTPWRRRWRVALSLPSLVVGLLPARLLRPVLSLPLVQLLSLALPLLLSLVRPLPLLLLLLLLLFAGRRGCSSGTLRLRLPQPPPLRLLLVLLAPVPLLLLTLTLHVAHLGSRRLPKTRLPLLPLAPARGAEMETRRMGGERGGRGLDEGEFFLVDARLGREKR